MNASAEQLAKLLDLTLAKVRELTDARVLTADADGYNPTASVTAYCRHLHGLLKRGGAAGVQTAALDQAKLEADVRIKRAKAEQEEMKLEALGREIRGKPKGELTAEDELTFKPVDTISGIARIVGITQQSLYSAVKGNAEAPKPTEGQKYDARAVLEWYFGWKYARRRPLTLREAELAEAVRLKKAKADLAEGKAVPIDQAQALAMQIYETCYSALMQNAKRYGKDRQKAEESARADFKQCRDALLKITASDS